MKKVLMAVDESYGSQFVLSVFKSMVQGPETTVLVHVRKPGSIRQKAIDQEPGQSKEEKILGFYKKEIGNDHTVKTLVKDGIPWQEILRAAREENVDIIILGCNKKSALRRFAGGGTITEVERNATVPVLVANTSGCKKSIGYDWRGEVYAA